MALTATPDGPTLDQRFQEGAKHYGAGRYDQAAEQWRTVVGYDITDGDLYYNLGNVSFQQGRPGEALAWYERARRLDPWDGDLQANMAAAMNAWRCTAAVYLTVAPS